MSGFTLLDYVRVVLTGSLYALVSFWILSSVGVGLLLLHAFIRGDSERPESDRTSAE